MKEQLEQLYEDRKEEIHEILTYFDMKKNFRWELGLEEFKDLLPFYNPENIELREEIYDSLLDVLFKEYTWYAVPNINSSIRVKREDGVGFYGLRDKVGEYLYELYFNGEE